MKIILSNSDRSPIYEQLENQIRDEILEGVLKPDHSLPSIRNLALDLGISVITVKRAYDDLEAEGYIHTVGGKGSFVAGLDVARLKEKKQQRIEEQLQALIKEMKMMGISRDTFDLIISLLWEEG
ncbi:MAG: GntR family transcriptional regulator [Bacillota bacterium]|nr:GntR family transcriptional regulator [Bacillota bacterium]